MAPKDNKLIVFVLFRPEPLKAPECCCCQIFRAIQIYSYHLCTKHFREFLITPVISLYDRFCHHSRRLVAASARSLFTALHFCSSAVPLYCSLLECPISFIYPSSTRKYSLRHHPLLWIFLRQYIQESNLVWHEGSLNSHSTLFYLHFFLPFLEYYGCIRYSFCNGLSSPRTWSAGEKIPIILRHINKACQQTPWEALQIFLSQSL